MLRDPLLGIGQIVETMNDWLRELGHRPNVTLLRYEDLIAAPNEQFRRALTAVGEGRIAEPHFVRALQFSRFGNMKKLEAAGAFDSKILQTRDAADPESANVRRGKIGGFKDYLSPCDQAYAAKAMQKLDSRFAYGPHSPAEISGPEK
jgi:hypothetical protein